ncbi:MAG: response regulator [Chloroflexi bacterium]|nr:response regulator [Chloroflexota bacterium]
MEAEVVERLKRKSKKNIGILVVEDESIIAKDIETTLNNLGYKALGFASRGKEAIKQAEEFQPDLVMMDIVLKGGMDGIEAAEEIRSRFNIPVIYLSAYSDENTLQRAKITEPFGFLLKPLDERELDITIEMALYKHDIETRLKENEQWLSTVLRNIGDSVVTVDKKGLITYINPVAELLLDRKHQEVLGRKFNDVINIIYEEDDEELKVDIADAFHSDSILNPGSNVVLVKDEGKKIPILVSLSFIEDEKGNKTGLVIAFRDITERREAEQKLQLSYETLKKTFEEMVTTLATTLEKRDPYTAGHQQRVANLAVAIAEDMGLSDEEIELIFMAGLIHDLGKIYVPAEILNKPGHLTELEFGMIKTHPEVGYEILKNVDFPWEVARVVHEHHERLNGTGYPNGIKKHEILMASRILSIADVVEAMASHRPYRPALSISVALDEILKNKGTLYDPEAVEACLNVFAEKGFVLKQV